MPLFDPTEAREGQLSTEGADESPAGSKMNSPFSEDPWGNIKQTLGNVARMDATPGEYLEAALIVGALAVVGRKALLNGTHTLTGEAASREAALIAGLPESPLFKEPAQKHPPAIKSVREIASGWQT